MSQLLSIFRRCLVILGVVGVGALAVLILRVLWLDHDAKAYVKAEVSRIVSPWNSQALLDQATPGLSMVLKSPNEAQALDALAKFGRLKHLGSPVGSLIALVLENEGDGTVGNYQVPARFEAGETTILIQVQRAGGRWRINGFQTKPEMPL